MSPGTVAVLRSLATTGFESKLALCFTHFDDMEGDNLPTLQSRQRHVMSSVDQILMKLGKDIGPSTERALRKSIAKRNDHLSSIDKPLHTDDKLGEFTISELNRLLLAIETKQDAAVQTTAYPVYEITKLVTRYPARHRPIPLRVECKAGPGVEAGGQEGALDPCSAL